MMVALDLVNKQRNHLPGKLEFQAVADEEIGTDIGTGYLCDRGLKGDFAIVGEPTGLGVCICHKGVLRFGVTTFGKAAHSGIPEKGVSAIMAMNKIMSSFGDYAAKIAKQKRHPILGPPTVNIGTIEGGVKVNIVPDRCKISAERRIVPPETISDAKKEISSLLVRTASQSSVKYRLDITNESEPSEIRKTEQVVSSLLKISAMITKKSGEPKGFNATCDARYLNKKARIPTAIFGPGSLEQCHKPDEHVKLTELEKAARIYALTFVDIQANNRLRT